MGYDNVAKLQADQLMDGIEPSANDFKAAGVALYEPCVKAKHHKISRGPSNSNTDNPLELVHMDVCGPFQEASLGGSMYLATFVDDYSSLSVVCPIKAESRGNRAGARHAVSGQETAPQGRLWSQHRAQQDASRAVACTIARRARRVTPALRRSGAAEDSSDVAGQQLNCSPRSRASRSTLRADAPEFVHASASVSQHATLPPSSVVPSVHALHQE